MLTPQLTPAADGRQEPFRWSRSQVAQALDDLADPHQPAPSQRFFAGQAGLPRSTLQYWHARGQRLDAQPGLAAFFESPAGLALLKRIVLAAHLTFRQAGPCGIRPLLAFFEQAGLAPFLACSYGTHQGLADSLQDLVLQYGSEQRQRLAAGMAKKKITLCEDENFHQDLPCLVAIEPWSNFILVEARCERRDAATWDGAVARATCGLPVEVVQVTSDEAKGLLAHAKDGLGAHHSPDLMHVQQELHKATALPLAAQVQKVQEEIALYQRLEGRHRAEQEGYQQGPAGPGRPPDFAGRIAGVQSMRQGAQGRLLAAQGRQEQAAGAIRGLGEDYHPFDSQTGAALEPDELRGRLQGRLGEVERLAEQAGVPQGGRERIKKARRLLPQMVATLAWFWAQVRLRSDELALTGEQREWFRGRLLPALYWEHAAGRGRDAKERQRLGQLAQGCRQAAWSDPRCPPGLSGPARGRLEEAARECAGRWVRSSSCVEGRNGQLALYHHGGHGLSEKRLAALTVLHNYWVRRADGTTAAQRFFGQRPADLFGWLLERFPDPPRPAQRRPKAQAEAQGPPGGRPNR
jgi:hypothetical protein